MEDQDALASSLSHWMLQRVVQILQCPMIQHHIVAVLGLQDCGELNA